MLNKRTVGIVGTGHVGAHVAFCLGLMGVAEEVLLCDKEEKKVIGECNDLNDAVPFMPGRTTYRVVDYAGLKDCDILVNAVGNIELCKNFDRDSELISSTKMVENIIPIIMDAGFHGIVVNITNPCDAITHLVAKLSGLPKGHVLGTGTLLDSARLHHNLTDKTDVDSRSITGYMMGEHGNSQFVPWTQVQVFGQSLGSWEVSQDIHMDREKAQQEVKKAGWVILAAKSSTEYGIACGAATLIRSVLRDEKRILPCSAELDGEYGEHDIFVGTPALIGKNGVEKVIEVRLPPNEMLDFKSSIGAIRTNIAKIKAIVEDKTK